MNRCLSLRAVVSFAAFTLMVGSVASAGPLMPPVGPVSPTYKTLTEVEPRIAINLTNTPGDADSLFKINAPGSYYLTGNIIGVTGKHGIEIATNDVTIDLNGFALIGVAGTLDGVATPLTRLNITVRNGTVRSWSGDGVELEAVDGGRVEAVLASANTGGGIRTGVAFTITNCSSHANTGLGIATDFGSTISHCSAYNNGLSGITTESSCTVTNCVARDNGQHGIVVLSGSLVQGCTTLFNSVHGLSCSGSNVILSNNMANNGLNGTTGAGIFASGTDNRIEGNNCINADFGIRVDGASNMLLRNTVSSNTTNWSIAAGNVFLVVQAPATASTFTGNAGGGGFGTTDPNANITY